MNANKIKTILNTRDPYEIAQALTLPPLANERSNKSKQRSYNERLTIDGVDWSPVLNSFLEARDYAFAVSEIL